MSLAQIISLFIATAIFVVSPGPGVFALISSSIALGVLFSIVLSLGLIAGDMVYLSLALFGMAKITQIWADFFFYVQFIGGVYLIIIGYQTIGKKADCFKSYNKQNKPNHKKTDLAKQWLMGFLISISNPKTILFYLGFLPAFIALENITIEKMLIIISTIFLACFSVCLIYIAACHTLRTILSSDKKVIYFNWLSGLLLIALGFYLQFRAFIN